MNGAIRSKITHALFEREGILVDSTIAHPCEDITIFKRFDRRIPRVLHTRFHPEQMEKTCELLIDGISASFDRLTFDKVYHKTLKAESWRYSSVKPGIMDLLMFLRDRKVSMAMLSHFNSTDAILYADKYRPLMSFFEVRIFRDNSKLTEDPDWSAVLLACEMFEEPVLNMGSVVCFSQTEKWANEALEAGMVVVRLGDVRHRPSARQSLSERVRKKPEAEKHKFRIRKNSSKGKDEDRKEADDKIKHSTSIWNNGDDDKRIYLEDQSFDSVSPMRGHKPYPHEDTRNPDPDLHGCEYKTINSSSPTQRRIPPQYQEETFADETLDGKPPPIPPKSFQRKSPISPVLSPKYTTSTDESRNPAFPTRTPDTKSASMSLSEESKPRLSVGSSLVESTEEYVESEAFIGNSSDSIDASKVPGMSQLVTVMSEMKSRLNLTSENKPLLRPVSMLDSPSARSCQTSMKAEDSNYELSKASPFHERKALFEKLSTTTTPDAAPSTLPKVGNKEAPLSAPEEHYVTGAPKIETPRVELSVRKAVWLVVIDLPDNAETDYKNGDVLRWIDYDPQYLGIDGRPLPADEPLDCETWSGQAVILPSNYARMVKSPLEEACLLRKRPRAQVINDFSAQNPNELSVTVGEVIYLLSEQDSDYVLAMNKTDKRGNVPKSILKILVPIS